MGQYLSIPFVIFGVALIYLALKSRQQGPHSGAAPKPSKKKKGKKKKAR